MSEFWKGSVATLCGEFVAVALVLLYWNLYKPEVNSYDTVSISPPQFHIPIPYMVELHEDMFSFNFTSRDNGWVGELEEKPAVLLSKELLITVDGSAEAFPVGTQVSALCSLDLSPPAKSVQE